MGKGFLGLKRLFGRSSVEHEPHHFDRSHLNTEYDPDYERDTHYGYDPYWHDYDHEDLCECDHDHDDCDDYCDCDY